MLDWGSFSKTVADVFGKREVKTPLSFFKTLIWLPLVLLMILPFLGLTEASMMRIIYIVIGCFFLLLIVVAILTCWKVTSLVYTPDTHLRARRLEYQYRYGIKGVEYSETELTILKAQQNPTTTSLPISPPENPLLDHREDE